MLDHSLCRRRQARLLDVLRERKLDCAVLASRPHAYWLCGQWPFWLNESAVVLWADRKAELVWADDPAPQGEAGSTAAFDELHAYQARRFATQRTDQPAALAEVVRRVLSGGRAKRVGVDVSPATAVLAIVQRLEMQSIEDEVCLLRRRKEADELMLMRKAIDCTRAMHERARQIVEPGVQETEVYSELHSAAVRIAGERLTPAYLGNDFASGPAGGGPRTNRPAAAGEIYILDLGPAYRGYFSDNCRAYAVDSKPSDVQMKAWNAIIGVFPIIERMARPGTRCRDLFAAADQHLRDNFGNSLIHHLGHGVGLFPHEYPHLNPEWDDLLEEGDVFTAEPGLYNEKINGGIRLENQYLVTHNGVENLTPFPMDL